MSDADLIPAATVLLLRDVTQSNGGIEVLMLRRNSKIAFAGMWVFPGGRVDPEDHVIDDELESARVAAVREAKEESDLDLQVVDLATWNHWQPPPVQAIPTGGPRRRFRTWFFVAKAPLGQVSIDDGEITDHAWLSPTDALARRDAGEIEMAPPTFVTLTELVAHATCDAAIEWARNRTPEHFHTRLMDKSSPQTITWHGDAGYESGDPTVPGGRHRLVLDPTGWVYERSF